MAKGYFIDPDTKQEYFGYDFISYTTEYDGNFNFKRFIAETPKPDDVIYYDRLYASQVVNNIDKITPTLSSKLFLDIGSPYANADVRKNYTITYKPENADYIMVSKQAFMENSYSDFLILPSIMKVVLFNFPYGTNGEEKYKKAAVKALKESFPDDWIMDNSKWVKTRYIQYNGKIDIRIAYDNKTKCAWYDSLCMNSGDDLTVDALMILAQAAKAQAYSSENEKNCVLALQMINNLNWRSYPGTMGRFSCLIGQRHNIYSEMTHHPSKYSKPVKEILTSSHSYQEEFAGEEDYNLWLAFIQKYLSVDGVKYIKMGDVNKRMRNEALYEDLFYQTFECITRVKPKSYDDYLSEKQV